MKILIDRDTFLHLRLPFSLFLMPVYLFALSQAREIHLVNAVLMFIALHLLIYPGSNLYNSYMDRDTGSIGGLKNPPPATIKLYKASILFDTAGLLISALINLQLFILMMLFIAVSKAYSWHAIRLKKYAITGWLVVMIFQGGYTFMLSSLAIQNAGISNWFNTEHLVAMLLAALLIGACYPFTQIYQHAEDSARGDYTISWILGIRGTFIFSGVLFVTATALALYYFHNYAHGFEQIIFLISMLPVVIYYFWWLINTWNNPSRADYKNTMRMTALASVCMILCWFLIYYLNNIITIM